MSAGAQWAARTGEAERARLRLPVDPLTGRSRAPDEATLRRLLSRLDRDALVAALRSSPFGIREVGRFVRRVGRLQGVNFLVRHR